MMLWKKIKDVVVTNTFRVAKNAQLFVNDDPSLVVVPLNYIATLVTQTIFTAARGYRVKSITGRVRVAGTGGACTIAFFKAPSGTAIGSGTALHSGSFNLVGTADAVQDLTLSAVAGALDLVDGDSIGYVLTGTATSAVGNVSIGLQPT